MVAGYFVPAVILVSLVTFCVWALAGPEPRMNFAVVTAVAVLVIACPCALGLATPISVMIAIGKAAAHGVLIRDGEALQRARRVDTVVLDKTGTLTLGKPSVAFAGTSPGVSESVLLEAAASVEGGVRTPGGARHRAVCGRARCAVAAGAALRGPPGAGSLRFGGRAAHPGGGRRPLPSRPGSAWSEWRRTSGGPRRRGRPRSWW